MMPPRWSRVGPYEYKPLAGTRGKGQSFERKVGRLLAKYADEYGWELHAHKWIIDGSRAVQPDFVLQSSPNRGILFECKLTWVDCSSQLKKYQNVLVRMGIMCIPVQVCRNLTPHCYQDVRASFEELTPDCVWHML